MNLRPDTTHLLRLDGSDIVKALLSSLGLTRSELAETIGASEQSLGDDTRSASPQTERRLRDLVQILTKLTDWSGSFGHAFFLFTSQPLSSFAGQTAADLLRAGRAEAVKAYVSRIEDGGYA